MALVLPFSGCTAKARNDWFADFLGGMVESAIFDDRDEQPGGYREPGISEQESRQRHAQKTLDEWDSDRRMKERQAQAERDASLMKNWLKRQEMDAHFNRDRSKDLF